MFDTLNEEVAECNRLRAEGRLREARSSYPGKISQFWSGNPPQREDCTEIEPLTVAGIRQRVARSAFGSVADQFEESVPILPTITQRAEEYAKDSSEPRSFEWAVQFPVLVQGRVHGTFYGNRWGWEYVTA